MSTFLCAAFSLVAACAVGETAKVLSNGPIAVQIVARDGSYEISAPGLERPVLTSSVGAEVDHHWRHSADYPRHDVSVAPFGDAMGKGQLIKVSFAGSSSLPALQYILRVYEGLPFGDIEVAVRNTTGKTLTVQAIRLVEALGEDKINLGGPPEADRVLSDSFSEDDPDMRIYDLGEAPELLHRGVGSQLIFNRTSRQSLFLGALTARRFLVVLRLKVASPAQGQAAVASYEVDSTGTTEVQRAGPLSDAPRKSLVKLSLPVRPGETITSERLMFAVGKDYHAQLEQYGQAIRVLHQARVAGPAPMGWWSWTAFYRNLKQGAALANAQWLADHLKTLGFDYFHLDEGYASARGEYTTANASAFPNGLRWFGQQVAALGLKLGVWTAPFEVSSQAWVYQHHKDWLVRDDQDEPLQIGGFRPGQAGTYVLDTTNPGAQQYLRQAYGTMAREWEARYIKLDFMESTAVEGHYYRPNTTALEAERIGITLIRNAVGNDVLIDKDGSPMLVPVGLVDEGRISVDTGHSFWASKGAAPGIAARYYMNRNFFVSDPDAFTVSRQSIYDHSWPDSTQPLTLKEAEVSIVLAAVTGGMYEIGDDLAVLGADPDRMALVENQDLLDMVRLGRAAVPLDLMSYEKPDEQPSVFLLHENPRQTIVAVFNWTEQLRSHTFTMAQLGLPAGHPYRAYDVFDGNHEIPLGGGVLRLDDEASHSVKLIKLVDASAALVESSLLRLSRRGFVHE